MMELTQLAAWVDDVDARLGAIEERLSGLDALVSASGGQLEAPPKKRGRPRKQQPVEVESLLTPAPAAKIETETFLAPPPPTEEPFDFISEVRAFVHATKGGAALVRRALDELSVATVRDVPDSERRNALERMKALAEEAL